MMLRWDWSKFEAIQIIFNMYREEVRILSVAVLYLGQSLSLS